MSEPPHDFESPPERFEVGDSECFATEPPPTVSEAAAPDWTTKPYKTNASLTPKGLQLPRKLYPPAYDDQPDPKDGPDAKAYKRIVSRLGRWPWSDFNDSYTDAFAGMVEHDDYTDSGVAGVQRQQGLEGNGLIAQRTFDLLVSALVPPGREHSGQLALDYPAENLIREAMEKYLNGGGGGSDIERVQAAIADYCERSIASEPAWQYEQFRPMNNLHKAPEEKQTADCSTHATCCFHWAKKVTGIAVPDPNGSGYNGYGYTGTLVNNPKTSAPYRIGDMGIYGTSTSNTTHVVTCYAPGSGSASLWASHGSDSGPYAVRLNYRSDLVCVVRPPLLP